MVSKRPIILVTNDDGVDAQGIRYLAETMHEYGEIYVCAPQQHQSGMGQAITLQTPLRAKCVKDEGDVHVYSVSGTPIDSMKFALDQLLPNHTADLVVSGINHGSNSANSAIYSGTVACVREGAINRIPSIAFSSLDFSPTINFEPYKPYIKKITETILTNGLDKHVFLNVNFPKPDRKIKGMRVCKQASGIWVEKFIGLTDPLNRPYYWLSGEFSNEEPENQNTDEWCLEHDIVSIVPLKVEETDMKTTETRAILIRTLG